MGYNVPPRRCTATASANYLPGVVCQPRVFLSRRPHVERVAIFIDGSNFYHCLKDEFGIAKLDMGKLVEKVRAGRDLVRTY